jgi:hypothetical protein
MGDEIRCADNCGRQVRCWVEHGSYTGEVGVGSDVRGICLPGQSGVVEAVRIEIERNHIGETPNILLWDRECLPGEEVLGECPGTPYHIVGTGCVEILDVLEVDLMRKEEYWPPPKCESNVKVIKARMLCDCTSECGSTIGGPALPWEVKAVSLIK